MNRLHFLISIFFMMMGPARIIPAFANITRGRDKKFKHKTALLAGCFASLICVFIINTAQSNSERLNITPESIRIAAGLVLLISAINNLFDKFLNIDYDVENKTPFQIAISPIATPMIISPGAIAIITHYSIVSKSTEGMNHAMWIALAVVLLLDFLGMYLNDYILKLPGFLALLRLVASAMNVVMLAGGIELIIISLTKLGLLQKLN